MRFGQRVKELRTAKGLTLRALASKVGCGFTYICKIEREKLDFAEYPSTPLIRVTEWEIAWATVVPATHRSAVLS